MRIGFTGTRQGLTELQAGALEMLLVTCGEVERCHHGGAEGADMAFHAMARSCDYFVTVHPAFGNPPVPESSAVLVLPTRQPLDRNRDIVALADVMIACPAGMQEETRSGTWMTIRTARKAKKPLYIIWPDGGITKETYW